MFTLDKILTIMLQPTALMTECALIGLLCSRWPIGRGLLVAAVVVLVLVLRRNRSTGGRADPPSSSP